MYLSVFLPILEGAAGRLTTNLGIKIGQKFSSRRLSATTAATLEGGYISGKGSQRHCANYLSPVVPRGRSDIYLSRVALTICRHDERQAAVVRK